MWARLMIRKTLFAAGAVLVLAGASLAATYTTTFPLSNLGYTDLGAGPLQVQVVGNQVGSFIVADTVPAAALLGVQLISGTAPLTFCQTQHVWGLGFGFGASVVVTPTTCAGQYLVSDAQSAPFAGVIAMTVGVIYAPQRSVRVVATVAGNVAFQFPDGSSVVDVIQVGIQTFPYACVQILSAGTTATASYYNIK